MNINLMVGGVVRGFIDARHLGDSFDAKTREHFEPISNWPELKPKQSHFNEVGEILEKMRKLRKIPDEATSLYIEHLREYHFVWAELHLREDEFHHGFFDNNDVTLIDW